MSYEVAAHQFQANANYGTWSIDFAFNNFLRGIELPIRQS